MGRDGEAGGVSGVAGAVRAEEKSLYSVTD